MKVPVEACNTAIEVKKSKFIAYAYPVATAQELKDLVNAMRKEHPQANHVVHAAVFGEQGTQFSMSDDREPKNTAGRPSLEVLKGSSITNIAVLIVRYFGGTLLGTGGLVKAYQDAVRAVLDILRTEELVEKTTFSLVIGYEVYDQVKLLLTTLKAQIQEDFGTSITINGTIESQKRLQLTDQIIELTRGTSTVSFH
ncbi:MAG: YigZ family protein [Sphaerochaetaceae bacterium]|jgi:uncharacterized YigZ family protein|nr:YigZ family protein [Sphaerochaetaceae bacterium]NLO59549.1 YigZ family protein [Spirochaetales bacterium]MDD2405668.1 YigZ family protein [Sphaerochaetaceae bacterium]MDD3671271.1 YigZ family protein [Sphaerochaetaceae bacterium]MDD4258410.1 YigZ family protein [Sphaerochaetaceae bacterium]